MLICGASISHIISTCTVASKGEGVIYDPKQERDTPTPYFDLWHETESRLLGSKKHG